MDSLREPTKGSDKCLDSQLWQACAGSMIQLLPLDSKVFYFPQGHAEHAGGDVDFGNYQIPPLNLCRVASIMYMADRETDEVYAKIRLVPLRMYGYDEYNFEDNEYNVEDDDGFVENDKPDSFAKTLTQSDANNGGGFSVPRSCAETIFPLLDYFTDPPVQTILAKDVHGETWKFRHIYRGTPRRHLLTTGWSNFVNEKKLVAGDSVVFFRTESGDLCIGIRRAKRGIGGGMEYVAGWNSSSSYREYSVFMKEAESKSGGSNLYGDLRGKVTPESVLEAATCAANGHPFEVIYYPQAGTPEFCVKASALRAAMKIQWCSGMRIKMSFETEDTSRISWFMGTISSVQVSDPIRWPNSPWRLLQIAWDEPELLEGVNHVSPWLVKVVPNMSGMHLFHFLPPNKKLRLQQNPEHIPAGIQGARHAQLGLSSLDLHLNTMHSGARPIGFQHFDPAASPAKIPSCNFMGNTQSNNNMSSLLLFGSPVQSLKENNKTKTPQLILFGQVILTEEQISQSSSGDTISNNSSSDGNLEKRANYTDGSGSAPHQNGPLDTSSGGVFPWFKDQQKADLDLETGRCKVFMDSEHVDRTLDLSLLGSYEDLYEKLANIFGIDSAEMLSNVLYQDAEGSTKHIGEESFSEFLKTAKRLTILMELGRYDINISDNTSVQLE